MKIIFGSLQKNILNKNDGYEIIQGNFDNYKAKDKFEKFPFDKYLPDDELLNMTEEEFQNQLNIYFGNIVVEDLSLTSDPEEHTINVSLKYSVANTNINDNINIEFNS